MTTQHDDIPDAHVVLIQRLDSGLCYWQVIDCPYCGQTHHHGGSRSSDIPLGFRQSHCAIKGVKGGQYRLVAD